MSSSNRMEQSGSSPWQFPDHRSYIFPHIIGTLFAYMDLRIPYSMPYIIHPQSSSILVNRLDKILRRLNKLSSLRFQEIGNREEMEIDLQKQVEKDSNYMGMTGENPSSSPPEKFFSKHWASLLPIHLKRLFQKRHY